MSKNYWDEYVKILVDNELLVNALKFHQSTITAISAKNETEKDQLRETWIEENGNKVHFSDIRHTVVNEKELPREIGLIFQSLKDQHKQATLNCAIMPILAVYKKIEDLEPALYSFDLNLGNLIKYHNIEDFSGSFPELHNVFFSLHYFLCIEEALVLYKQKAYRYGVIQAGKLAHEVEQTLDIGLHEIEIPEQKLTYDFGINVRKQLLVYSQYSLQ